MGNHKEGRSPGEHTMQGALEVLRIEGGKALVENDHVGVLQERPGHVETAALAVRELPSCLPDHLPQPGRHLVEQVTETELTAHGFRLLNVCGLGRPAATHQQVEGERAGQDVVFMELRSGHDALPPTVGS
jgi:hypothetical protein